MKRGEIRWYKFTHPDKNRPALVLTRDSVLQYLAEVTIAPVTSTVRDIPSEVFLSKADGMPHDCAVNWVLRYMVWVHFTHTKQRRAVNCDHLQAVSKGKIGSLITTLPQDKIEDVGQAICFSLDI